MSCIGNGKMVGLALEGMRPDELKWLDLDCDEDWGDIDCGTKEDGSSWAAVGNDEDGYTAVLKAYEEDGAGGVREITLGELREMVESRIEAYSS